MGQIRNGGGRRERGTAVQLELDRGQFTGCDCSGQERRGRPASAAQECRVPITGEHLLGVWSQTYFVPLTECSDQTATDRGCRFLVIPRDLQGCGSLPPLTLSHPLIVPGCDAFTTAGAGCGCYALCERLHDQQWRHGAQHVWHEQHPGAGATWRACPSRVQDG